MSQLPNLDPDKIPTHVAFIMDGNGRWAKQRNLPRALGHQEGRKTLKKIIMAASQLGIKYLSVYTFSTENWNRPQPEVSFLMNFLGKSIDEEIQEMGKKGVRICFMGDLEGLPNSLQKKCHSAMKQTQDNQLIQLNIMLNYGSRQEIIQAVNQLLAKGSGPINESEFSKHLYSANTPDPEILIRTSGEYRISNYLLWQIAYTELFFVDQYWPDFNAEDLHQIIHQYQNRERRFGGLL